MNVGHGHVNPREDGVRMRCGGPGICAECSKDLAANVAKHLTDKDLLDWLERQNKKATYTGRCAFRWSMSDRGWRLHETGDPGAATSVRDAIAMAIRSERQETEARVEALRKEAADLEEQLHSGHGWGV